MYIMGYIKLTQSIVQIVSTTTPYSAMVLQLTLSGSLTVATQGKLIAQDVLIAINPVQSTGNQHSE